jgi:hypothetical protein
MMTKLMYLAKHNLSRESCWGISNSVTNYSSSEVCHVLKSAFGLKRKEEGVKHLLGVIQLDRKKLIFSIKLACPDQMKKN